MTNKEILRKVLRKAYGENFEESVFDDETRYTVSPAYVREVVFEHSFAKAFWGEEKMIIKTERITESFSFQPKIENIVAWQYHLQQMVLEEEPLKYLEKFL